MTHASLCLPALLAFTDSQERMQCGKAIADKCGVKLKSSILLVALLSVFCGSTLAADFILADRRIAPAPIVVFQDAPPRTREAAVTLADYIEKISGSRPDVHDGEAYGRLLQPTYAAVKQASPDVTVVGIGGEYGPKCADHILGAVRTAGPDAMDAWSIHAYRYLRAPEASGLMEEPHLHRRPEPDAQDTVMSSVG